MIETELRGISGSLSIDTSVWSCGGTFTVGRGRGVLAGFIEPNSDLIRASMSAVVSRMKVGQI